MIEELLKLKQQLKLSDKEIIGDWLMPEDQDRDHIAANDNYAWYYVIGQYFKPRTIAEIGVKYGYSIKSLITGAGGKVHVTGYDNEIHRPGSNTIVRDRLLKLGVDHDILTQNTHKLTTLSKNFDLVHVDGSHITEHALYDMKLGWKALNPGGVLLVDDCYYIPDVQLALQEFCSKNKLISTCLPSFRGLSVVIK